MFRSTATRLARPLQHFTIRCLSSKPLKQPKHSTSTQTTPTPSSAASVFGLEEQDLESFVQGLYFQPPVPKEKKAATTTTTNEAPISSSSSPSSQPQQSQDSPPEAKDKYSEWFTSSGESAARVPKSQAQINRGGDRNKSDESAEVLRVAAFGTVRFDNENPARDEDDMSFDRPPPHLEHERPDFDLGGEAVRARNRIVTESLGGQLDQEELQQQRPAFKMPPIVTKSAGAQEDTTSNEEASEEKTEKLGLSRVPRVYRPEPFNEITHQDMWNLLSKQIIFDNDFLIGINKPAGLPIHSPAITCRHTLIEFLPELAQLTNCKEVFPLHRLDKETTGVLLLAKTEQAAAIIKQKFAKQEITKKYLAITKNCPEIDQGTVKIPIAEGQVFKSHMAAYRSTLRPDLSQYSLKTKATGAREAVTHFRLIASDAHYAFLEVNPETGVKHQIRVHLGFGIGCPVLGDHKYSHRDKLAPQRLSPEILKLLKLDQSKVRHLPLHLHCSSISFSMPEGFSESSNSIFVHARLPEYFKRSLKVLKLK